MIDFNIDNLLHDRIIQVKDNNAMQELLDQANKSGYVMACDFDKTIPTAEKIINDYKKYIKSKAYICLWLSYNNITNRRELSYANMDIIKSYPQYNKPIRVYSDKAIKVFDLVRGQL